MEIISKKPIEIFRGIHDQYYGMDHSIKVNEVEVNFRILDLKNKSLTNPNDSDSEVIEKWKKNTSLKPIKSGISYFAGSESNPLTYLIDDKSSNSVLLIIETYEVQPGIYSIRIEEMWKL